MARPLRPLIRSGGFYPSRKWTPLVYAGGYTTANGGEEPAPPPIEKTITGNPIHITDALAKPAQALSVKLEPIQDLHGYDAPWPAGGGKNLLPSGGAFDVTNNGVRFTSDGKGNYTVKGTATANAFYNFLIEEVTLPSTVFAHLLNNASNYNVSLAFFYGNTQVDYTAMAPQMRIIDKSSKLGGKTINGLRFFVSSGAEIDISCSPMLCVDNTATPYSPYSNICPISGWTEAKVTRTGRNLCPYEGVNYTADTHPNGIFLKAGTYIFSLDTGVAFGYNHAMYIKLKDENGNVITNGNISGDGWQLNGSGTYYYGGGDTNMPKPFNLLKDCYVCFGFNNQYPTDGNNVQLELGSTATDYEPYNGNSYSVTFPDEVFGATPDIVSGEMPVTMTEVDLGNLTWTKESGRTESIIRFATTDLRGSIKKPSSGSEIISAICSQYAPSNANNSYLGYNEIVASDTSGKIFIVDTRYDALAANEFKAAMSGVQLVYELATPTTIQLTPTQVELLLGENNIWSDGTMTLVYLADGNASDVEALNILLGGRYVNNHGEDEPTDREALDIVLGGDK